MRCPLIPDPAVTVPDDMLSAFPPSQLLVLGVVAAWVGRSDLWRAEMSRREIAEAAGVSRTSVEGALRKARGVGLIQEEPSPTFQLGNTIEIIAPSWRERILASGRRGCGTTQPAPNPGGGPRLGQGG